MSNQWHGDGGEFAPPRYETNTSGRTEEVRPDYSASTIQSTDEWRVEKKLLHVLVRLVIVGVLTVVGFIILCAVVGLLVGFVGTFV